MLVKNKNIMAEKAKKSEGLKKRKKVKYTHTLEKAFSKAMRKALWKTINQKLKSQEWCLTYTHSALCSIRK